MHFYVFKMAVSIAFLCENPQQKLKKLFLEKCVKGKRNWTRDQLAVGPCQLVARMVP